MRYVDIILCFGGTTACANYSSKYSLQKPNENSPALLEG
ncbi:MAG: hypothetical protein ACI9RZ_000693 [Sphingobacteriales bacterium]|jgi:hypothetical protein